MTKHRDLNFGRLIAAIPEDLFRRYFEIIDVEPPDGWAKLNGDEFEQWLRREDHRDCEALIRQQLMQINDIAERSANVLAQAFRKYELTMDSRITPEAHAMTLFVDYPKGYEYAWTRYLLYANGDVLTDFFFPARNVALDADSVARMRRGVSEFFDGQAKGHQCRVRVIEDSGEVIVTIQRGSYVKTMALFDRDSDDVQFRTFRPVVDDVIVFDAESKILRIKASTTSERGAYLWQFAGLCDGREDLCRAALSTKIYDLGPIHSGKFDFGGDRDVLEVRLVRARFRRGPRLSVEYKGEDVASMLALEPVAARAGSLVSAGLSFRLRGPNGAAQARCDITPPARGKIPDDYRGQIIEAYLKDQGVKLL